MVRFLRHHAPRARHGHVPPARPFPLRYRGMLGTLLHHHRPPPNRHSVRAARAVGTSSSAHGAKSRHQHRDPPHSRRHQPATPQPGQKLAKPKAQRDKVTAGSDNPRTLHALIGGAGATGTPRQVRPPTPTFGTRCWRDDACFRRRTRRQGRPTASRPSSRSRTKKLDKLPGIGCAETRRNPPNIQLLHRRETAQIRFRPITATMCHKPAITDRRKIPLSQERGSVPPGA